MLNTTYGHESMRDNDHSNTIDILPPRDTFNTQNTMAAPSNTVLTNPENNQKVH